MVLRCNSIWLQNPNLSWTYYIIYMYAHLPLEVVEQWRPARVVDPSSTATNETHISQGSRSYPLYLVWGFMMHSSLPGLGFNVPCAVLHCWNLDLAQSNKLHVSMNKTTRHHHQRRDCHLRQVVQSFSAKVLSRKAQSSLWIHRWCCGRISCQHLWGRWLHPMSCLMGRPGMDRPQDPSPASWRTRNGSDEWPARCHKNDPGPGFKRCCDVILGPFPGNAK